ncbi:MAG TPA: thiamine phosphate synthase [Longimicrobium sp.]|nr:thiamine phosphate synthase [Longimicrobium sp.]
MESEPERVLPPLHVVTDDEVVARPDFLPNALRVMEIGGSHLAFHLRAPRTSGRRLYDLAATLLPRATGEGALLLVNDRIDVALAARADGVQLGAWGIGIADARRLLGRERWIGASVHSGDEAREAAADGADFVIAGAVYATESHPGQAGAGLGVIEDAVAAGVPVIAIGGITPERAGDVMAAGAAGVAAIRGVWDGGDVVEAVRRYLRAVGR